jgi:hypothetical protein
VYGLLDEEMRQGFSYLGVVPLKGKRACTPIFGSTLE